MKKLKQGSKSPSFFKVPHDVKRVQIQRVVTGRCIAKYRQVAYQNGEQNMNVKLRISWYERVEPIAVGWAWNWAFGQNRKLVPNPPLLVIDQNGAGGGGPGKNVGDFGAFCARRAMNRSGSCARSSWRYDTVKPLLREVICHKADWSGKYDGWSLCWSATHIQVVMSLLRKWIMLQELVVLCQDSGTWHLAL